ncbi:MAG: hypothetical protein LBF76_02670, partial [Holosporales bacterium]|nr:hypothetical protein [Holosporales bacterium]
MMIKKISLSCCAALLASTCLMSPSLVCGMGAADAKAFWKSKADNAPQSITSLNDLECVLQEFSNQQYNNWRRMKDLFWSVNQLCPSPEEQGRYIDRLVEMINSKERIRESGWFLGLLSLVDSQEDICLVVYDSLIKAAQEEDKPSFVANFLADGRFWKQGSKFHNIWKREMDFLSHFDLSPFFKESGSFSWFISSDDRITQEEKVSLLRCTLQEVVSRKDISKLRELTHSHLQWEDDNALLTTTVIHEMLRGGLDLELVFRDIFRHYDNKTLLLVLPDIVNSSHAFGTDYASKNLSYLFSIRCYEGSAHDSFFFQEVAKHCMTRDGHEGFLLDFLRWNTKRVVLAPFQRPEHLLHCEEGDLLKCFDASLSFFSEFREEIMHEVFMVVWENLPLEEYRQYFAAAALNNPSMPRSIRSFALHCLAERDLMLSIGLSIDNEYSPRTFFHRLFSIGSMFVGGMDPHLGYLTSKRYSSLTEGERILVFRHTIQEAVSRRDKVGLRRLMEFFSEGNIFHKTKDLWANLDRKDDALVAFLIGECVCHDVNLASIFDYGKSPFYSSEDCKRILSYVFDLMLKNYRSLDEISFFKNLDVLFFDWNKIPYGNSRYSDVARLMGGRDSSEFLPAFLQWKVAQFRDRGAQHEDPGIRSLRYFEFYKVCHPFLHFSSDEEAANFLREILVAAGPYCYNIPRMQLSEVLSQKERNIMEDFYGELQYLIRRDWSVTSSSMHVSGYGTIVAHYRNNDGSIYRIERDYFPIFYEEKIWKRILPKQTSSPA